MKIQCPKCKKFSGDDWAQCNGECPMSMSPHYHGKGFAAEAMRSAFEFGFRSHEKGMNLEAAFLLFDQTMRGEK